MELMLAVGATMIFIICALVTFLTRNYRLFSIWNYFLAYVFLNIVIRTYLIVFDVGTVDPWSTFLRGITTSDMVWGSIFYSLSCVFLGLGYMSVGRKSKLSFWPRSISAVGFGSGYLKTLQYKLVFLFIISFISFLYFLNTTYTGIDLNLIEGLSGYRGTTTDLSEYSARGYLRLLVGFSDLVFFVAMYLIMERQGNKRFLITLAIFSFLIALSMGIFTSSRARVVMLFIEVLILQFVLNKRKVNPFTLLLVTCVVVLLFTFMTSLRAGSGLNEFSFTNILTNFFSHTILNNGGLDISKTVLVKQYVDDTFNMQLGSTLVLFLLLAIPRDFWAGKPVNLDTFIGFEVYGAQTFGTGAVPPGFPAEMYLNFHYGGVFVGLFVLGFLSKLLHNDFLMRRSEPFYPVYYVLVVLSFLYSVMGSGFSSTIMGKLIVLLPLLFLLKHK